MKKIESAAVMAAKATVKAAGHKLSSKEGKNMLADLMAANNPSFRVDWDSIPHNGLFEVLSSLVDEGLDPRDASDWNPSAFQNCFARQPLTSEQAIKKQFGNLFPN
jgi:hypothetical protein